MYQNIFTDYSDEDVNICRDHYSACHRQDKHLCNGDAHSVVWSRILPANVGLRKRVKFLVEKSSKNYIRCLISSQVNQDSEKDSRLDSEDKLQNRGARQKSCYRIKSKRREKATLENLMISWESTAHSKQPGLRQQDQVTTSPSAGNSSFNICSHLIRIISGKYMLWSLWKETSVCIANIGQELVFYSI